MQNCNIVKFYQDRCVPHTRIEADFLLYTDNQKYMLHLFAVREHNSNQFSPRSFVVKTIGNESFETEITEQNTIIGTQTSGGMGFGRGPGMWQ